MIMTLFPYLFGPKTWVFDDESHNLKAEAFVCGMSEIMSCAVSKFKIKNAGKGFKMSFSDQPFDGQQVELTWVRPHTFTFEYMHEGKKIHNEIAGNIYHTGNSFKKVKAGWLCPALLKYFPEPPKTLYVKVERLPMGVDPIWHVRKADAFVEAEMQPVG